jgi:hypothetical protein
MDLETTRSGMTIHSDNNDMRVFSRVSLWVY